MRQYYGLIAILAFVLVISHHYKAPEPMAMFAAVAAGSGPCEKTYQECIKNPAASQQRCYNEWSQCVASKCFAKDGDTVDQCPKDQDCEMSCTELANSTQGLLACCFGGPKRNNTCRKMIDGKCALPSRYGATSGQTGSQGMPSASYGSPQSGTPSLPQLGGGATPEGGKGDRLMPGFNDAWNQRVYEPYSQVGTGIPEDADRMPSTANQIQEIGQTKGTIYDGQGVSTGLNSDRFGQYFTDMQKGLDPEAPLYEPQMPKEQSRSFESQPAFPTFKPELQPELAQPPQQNVFQKMWGGVSDWWRKAW